MVFLHVFFLIENILVIFIRLFILLVVCDAEQKNIIIIEMICLQFIYGNATDNRTRNIFSFHEAKVVGIWPLHT